MRASSVLTTVMMLATVTCLGPLWSTKLRAQDEPAGNPSTPSESQATKPTPLVADESHSFTLSTGQSAEFSYETTVQGETRVIVQSPSVHLKVELLYKGRVHGKHETGKHWAVASVMKGTGSGLTLVLRVTALSAKDKQQAKAEPPADATLHPVAISICEVPRLPNHKERVAAFDAACKELHKIREEGRRTKDMLPTRERARSIWHEYSALPTPLPDRFLYNFARLARTAIAAGEYDVAQKALELALPLRRQSLPREHNHVREALRLYSQALFDTGQWERAIEILEERRQIHEQIGDKPQELATVVRQLASARRFIADRDRAGTPTSLPPSGVVELDMTVGDVCSFTVETSEDVEYSIWAVSRFLDLQLSLQPTAKGAHKFVSAGPFEGDKRMTPVVRLDVGGGTASVVTVAALAGVDGEVRGSVSLVCRATPWTAEARATCARWGESQQSLHKLGQADDPAKKKAAVEQCRELAAEIVAYDGPPLPYASLWFGMKAIGDAYALHEHRTVVELTRNVAGRVARVTPPDGVELQYFLSLCTYSARKVGLTAAQRDCIAERMSARLLHHPEEHPSILGLRAWLGIYYFETGQLEKARAVQEALLQALGRVDPPDLHEQMRQRLNYANTLDYLGDLHEAMAQRKQVLDHWERVLPPDHDDLQRIRMNYANDLSSARRHEEAIALAAQALEVLEGKYPAEHPMVLRGHGVFALKLGLAGRWEEAREWLVPAVERAQRVLPPEHNILVTLLSSYAALLRDAGDLRGSIEQYRHVLEIRERRLPSHHPRIQFVRVNLANSYVGLGEHATAKSLREKVLAVWDQALPNDHHDLRTIRTAYAQTLRRLGDLAGAKQMTEAVLAVDERSKAPTDSALQDSRLAYARVLRLLGEHEKALELVEKTLSVLEAQFDPGHPNLVFARSSQAAVYFDAGRYDEARAAYARVVADDPRGLEHHNVQVAHQNLALAHSALGDFALAEERIERVLEVREKTLAPGDPVIDETRIALIGVLHARIRLAEEPGELQQECDRHIERLIDNNYRSARKWDSAVSSRQLALKTRERAGAVELALRSASPEARAGTLGVKAHQLHEELQAAVARARRLPLVAAEAAADAKANLDKLHFKRALARKAVAEFIAKPDLPVDASPEETTSYVLARLVRDKELAETAYLEAVRRLPGAADLMRDVPLSEIASHLPANGVAVSYVRYLAVDWKRVAPDEEAIAKDRKQPALEKQATEQLAAFVLTPAGASSIVELGPAKPLIAAAVRWSAACRIAGGRGLDLDSAGGQPAPAVDEFGHELRRALIDPIAAQLPAGTNQLVVTIPPWLGRVALDALPLASDEVGELAVPATATARVGDRLSIHVVSGQQWLVRKTARPLNAQSLVAFGGIDYGTTPEEIAQAELPKSTARHGGSVNRGTAVRGGALAPLPFTATEVEALSRTFEDEFGEGSVQKWQGTRADKERFRAFAPGARYLHIATHGWFAPESVPSILDERPDDARIGIQRSDFRQNVHGYEPLALCGLALSGAALPADPDGTHPGVLDGTEIAALDLGGVELAVLSACETNVGLQRRGQGVMSLQEALFAAGVRHSITSLWKVPDAATMELMTRFYDGIWQRGESKHEALWNAKTELRSATDDAGKPRYTVRDWAGWVLFGPPE
ncbi:MAG: CHAT domain-containing tetratricopeptide repeat protein [Planctomycetota bacterium]